MNLHSISEDQRLYVIRAGEGFSCYGFDVLHRKATAVAKWSKVVPPLMQPGTREHFEWCAAIMDHGAKYAEKTRTRCDADLTPELIGLEGQRVEVKTPDGETSRFYVGKSTGWMPSHLAIKTQRSSGGCVVYFPAGSTVRKV